MNYAARFFRFSSISVAAAVVNGLLYYVLRRVLYTHLPAEDYGLFYVVIHFYLMLVPFLALGFDPGTVPYITRFREKDDAQGRKGPALPLATHRMLLSDANATRSSPAGAISRSRCPPARTARTTGRPVRKNGAQ